MNDDIIEGIEGVLDDLFNGVRAEYIFAASRFLGRDSSVLTAYFNAKVFPSD